MLVGLAVFMLPGTPFVRVLVIFAVVVAATAPVTVPFIRSTLERPLPYQDPAGLIVSFDRIAYLPLPAAPGRTGSFSLLEWQRENRKLDGLAGFHWQKFDVPSTGGKTETVQGSRVSRDFFGVLGVRAALGRVFSEEPMPQPGPDERRVVLSDAFWRQYFGAAPDVVGRTLTLEGKDYTIDAVMPPGFWFLAQPPPCGRVSRKSQRPRKTTGSTKIRPVGYALGCQPRRARLKHSLPSALSLGGQGR